MNLMTNKGIMEYEKLYHRYIMDGIPNEFLEKRRTLNWTTISGQKILIKDISDTHLDNIINLYIKKKFTDARMYHIIMCEKKFRKLNYIIVPAYS